MNTPPDSELTPEQQAAFEAGMQAIQHIAQFIVPFGPAMTPEELERLAVGALDEQTRIMQEIFPTLIHGHPNVLTHPTLQVMIRGPNGVEGVVPAPKRLENVEDPQPAIQWAFMLALLLSPSVRAVLKASGFTYHFMQTTQDVSRPTGIIVKH